MVKSMNNKYNRILVRDENGHYKYIEKTEFQNVVNRFHNHVRNLTWCHNHYGTQRLRSVGVGDTICPCCADTLFGVLVLYEMAPIMGFLLDVF